MHAVRLFGVVAEDDLDGVADFCADHRAKNAHVLVFRRPRLERLKCGVGVLAINGLAIDLSNAIFALLDPDQGGLVEGLAGHVVYVVRSVVPFDLVGRDEILSHLTGGLSWRLLLGVTRQNEHAKR
jgi:hypothetical protein